MRIPLTKKSPVSIGYHNLTGRKLFGVTTKELDAGTRLLALPKTGSATGFSLLSVESPKEVVDSYYSSMHPKP